MPQYVQVTSVNHDDLRLKKNVLLAYTDLAAGASRALLGIDMRVEYCDMSVPELVNHRPACVRDGDLAPTEQHFLPLQVLNCKYEDYSVVVVNTLVEGKDAHYVASRIMELCIQSEIDTLNICTILKLDLKKPQPIYENSFFTNNVTDLPSIPANAKICDPFFSTLLQMIQVERLPTRCYVIPGHRGSLGQAATSTDGAREHIKLFQDFINEQTGLKFDIDLSCNLMYKGKNTDDLDMASAIYM